MRTCVPRLVLLGSVLFYLVVVDPTTAFKHQHRKKLAKEREEREHREINVCDIVQAKAPLYCHCNDPKLSAADEINCLVFNKFDLSDPVWAHFNSQMYVKKLTFTVKNDGSLTYVPTQVLQQLKSLYYISFHYSEFGAIESQAFAQIFSVSELYLSKNGISVLKWHAFEGLKNLTMLNLDDNEIVEISKDIFYDVPKLQKLFLNNNNVSILHDRAFKHLPSLQELHLNNNKLTSLRSDSFQGLDLLQKLELSNNQITTLEANTFADMPELVEINLENNKINHIANWALDGLKKLRQLRLAENKLVTLENDFLAGAPSINFLDLRSNAIRTMTFDNIKPVITNFYNASSNFFLEGNKLVCDCKLGWIWGLKNETQNPHLREVLADLKCLLDAQYEAKLDQSVDNYNRALEIVRAGDYNDDTNYPDDDYEMALKVGHQVDLDGKTAIVRKLFDFDKPENLPCPQPSKEEVMASEQPSGRHDQISTRSFFSFVNSADSLGSQQKYATLLLVALGVFACFT